jgi:hypothetical protein
MTKQSAARSVSSDDVLEIADQLQQLKVSPESLAIGDADALSKLREYLANPDCFTDDFTLAFANYVGRWHIG